MPREALERAIEYAQEGAHRLIARFRASQAQRCVSDVLSLAAASCICVHYLHA